MEKKIKLGRGTGASILWVSVRILRFTYFRSNRKSLKGFTQKRVIIRQGAKVLLMTLRRDPWHPERCRQTNEKT